MVNFKKRLKIAGIVLSMLFLTVVTFSFVANVFSYFDPFNLCYIGIENDVVKGNQRTIKAALSAIKESSPQDYKNVCGNVDLIAESYCLASDSRGGEDKEDVGYSAPGCYIQGSRIIYVIPSKLDSDQVIKQRADTIQKYAVYSERFWKSY